MFGDNRWIDSRTSAQEARLHAWLQEIRTARLVVIECGAGAAIPTVRLFSELHAKAKTSVLIRINIRECNVRSGVAIEAGALEALTAIDALLA
jgi:hypothetical protein